MRRKQKKSYEIDMCNGSILKKLLIFTIPLICSSMLQLLFNAADVVVVGQFAGDNSLAAVGSTTVIINLLMNLFIGLSIGANVLVARYYGAKREEELSKTVHTAMLLSVYSGLLLTVVGVIGARYILIWMQTPEEVLDLATLYLRIYFLGMTATMTYNFGSAILRAKGDTKRPLYYLFGAGIINVILNLVFVIIFKMDVAGVALATVISQVISAILVVRCLMKEEDGIKLNLKSLHIDKESFKAILKIGLPAGLQGTIFSLSNVVIQSSINSFGAIVVAGNSAAANLEGFVYVAMNAFHQSAISFTSQNVGAGKYERIRKIAIISEVCVLAVGGLLGNAVVLWGENLLTMYSNHPEVIHAGVQRLQIIGSTYFLCGMMDVMVGVLRGMGYSIMPMIVSLIGACGLRLLWLATIFQVDRFHTITTVYMSYPITWIITLSVHLICFMCLMPRLERKLKGEVIQTIG